MPEVVTSKQSLKEEQRLPVLRGCLYVCVLLGGGTCDSDREGKSEGDTE